MASSKSRRAGRKAGKASRACKGKKGRAFHSCRRRYFATH